MDGHKQRQALTAVERALEALGAGDGGAARRAIGRAVELDQLGIFGPLGEAVELAATGLDETGVVGVGTWDAIAAAVGPGPLEGLVARVRTGGAP